MRAAVVGQQTASGISPMGVKATPAWPVDNFTPVKKMPMTTSSTEISFRGAGDLSVIWAMVSAMTEDIFASKSEYMKLSLRINLRSGKSFDLSQNSDLRGFPDEKEK
jgi:hypothetical protein